ncbi:response regulator transcription factor [Marinobacter sp. 1Y8]
MTIIDRHSAGIALRASANDASSAPMLNRVLIVDDHPFFSDGLGHILLRERLAAHVDHAVSVEKALTSLNTTPDTDLILLDVGLPGEGGLSLLPRLDDAALPVPVVVISSHEDETTVRAARAAGAQGFMPKSCGGDVLVKVIQRIARGDLCFPAAATADNPALRLTPRQQDVLQLLAEGLPNKRICQELDLTEHTVKSHLKAVFQALDVHNRTECVTLARSLGLVGTDNHPPL